MFEAFEREITGMQEETNNDLIYAFLDYVLSDNRYREKLNELTEINLKDRKIYIEETENHDDENDRVDNRKYEKLDENKTGQKILFIFKLKGLEEVYKQEGSHLQQVLLHSSGIKNKDYICRFYEN